MQLLLPVASVGRLQSPVSAGHAVASMPGLRVAPERERGDEEFHPAPEDRDLLRVPVRLPRLLSFIPAGGDGVAASSTGPMWPKHHSSHRARPFWNLNGLTAGIAGGVSPNSR